MDEMLSKALTGVDPTAPGAFWHIFASLLAMVPWWPLTIFTVVSVAGAALLAWRRGGNPWHAVWWSLVVGPIAWIIIAARNNPPRPCPRCATPVPAGRDRCQHCGCRMGAPQVPPPAA